MAIKLHENIPVHVREVLRPATHYPGPCAQCGAPFDAPPQVNPYCIDCLRLHSYGILIEFRLSTDQVAYTFPAWKEQLWALLRATFPQPLTGQQKLWLVAYLCELGIRRRRRGPWWERLRDEDLPALCQAAGLKNIPQVSEDMLL